MRAFQKQVGAITVHKVSLDETGGPVCCDVDGCHHMAFQRVSMAGYPAGFVCAACARSWLKLWVDMLTEPEPLAVAA